MAEALGLVAVEEALELVDSKDEETSASSSLLESPSADTADSMYCKAFRSATGAAKADRRNTAADKRTEYFMM